MPKIRSFRQRINPMALRESRLENLRPSLQGTASKYWVRCNKRTWHSLRRTSHMKQRREKTKPIYREINLIRIKASSTLEIASASIKLVNRRHKTSQIKCMVDPHSTTFLQATMSAVAQEEVLISHSIKTCLTLPYCRTQNRIVHLATNPLRVPPSGRARVYNRARTSS